MQIPIQLIINIESKRQADDRNGKPYSIFYFSDKTGEDSSGLFQKNFYDYDKYLIPGRAVLLQATIKSHYRSLGNFTLETRRVIPAEDILQTSCHKLELALKSKELDQTLAEALITRMVSPEQSPTKIQIQLIDDEVENLQLVTSRLHIAIDDELIDTLESQENLAFRIH